MVDVLAKCLPKIKTDWSKWRIFFCDERVVEPGDGRTNFALYKSNFIGKVPVTEEQFIRIDPELSGTRLIIHPLFSSVYFFSTYAKLLLQPERGEQFRMSGRDKSRMEWHESSLARNLITPLKSPLYRYVDFFPLVLIS